MYFRALKTVLTSAVKTTFIISLFAALFFIIYTDLVNAIAPTAIVFILGILFSIPLALIASVFIYVMVKANCKKMWQFILAPLFVLGIFVVLKYWPNLPPINTLCILFSSPIVGFFVWKDLAYIENGKIKKAAP